MGCIRVLIPRGPFVADSQGGNVDVYKIPLKDFLDGREKGEGRNEPEDIIIGGIEITASA